MGTEADFAFTSIRRGELSAADAWHVLAPLVEKADLSFAVQLCDALRSWTWKALDRRRRDPELREWVDVLNRVEAFLADQFETISPKIEVLAELIHESLAVAELVDPDDLMRRRHVAPILAVLRRREGEWAARSVLMEELNLMPANTTRLMSLLVDAGWVEQLIVGREAVYRLTAEGIARSRTLAAQPLPQTLRGPRARAEAQRTRRPGLEWTLLSSSSLVLSAFDTSESNVLCHSQWEHDMWDVATAIEEYEPGLDEDSLDLAIEPAAPVLPMAA